MAGLQRIDPIMKDFLEILRTIIFKHNYDMNDRLPITREVKGKLNTKRKNKKNKLRIKDHAFSVTDNGFNSVEKICKASLTSFFLKNFVYTVYLI